MATELAQFNVFTTVLCPGLIATNIVKDGNKNMKGGSDAALKQKQEGFFERFGANPERVAKAVLKGVKRRKPMVLAPSSHIYPMWIVKRISYPIYIFFQRIGASMIDM
jgi:short-subunit dehydrogenase